MTPADLKRLRELWAYSATAGEGQRVVISSDQHDRLIAADRWLPQLLDEVEGYRDLTRDLTRAQIAGEIWRLKTERDENRAEVDRLRNEREAWQDTAATEGRNRDFYRSNQLALQLAIHEAMNHLGVPQPGYPAPVAVAHEILDSALDVTGIVDGKGVHSKSCPRVPCECHEDNDTKVAESSTQSQHPGDDDSDPPE